VLEETSLEEIAREAADMSFGEQAGRSVDFILHPLPRMRVDYMCVRDLFCNLFSNALKYNTQAVRRIEVGTVATDTLPSVPPAARGKIAIWVRDNGIGIARQHYASVFEVFRRLHLPNEFGGGTGAGLAIVRKIVDRHGGSLWLDSIPGQGTTFYLCFPDSSDVHA
jgi:signal transduction histidine kinase